MNTDLVPHQSLITDRLPITNKGFTLLELILALAILSFGLIAIIGSFTAGLRASKLIQDEITAQSLAQQKMEELLMQESLTWGYSDGDFGPDYPLFCWQTEIIPQDDPDLQKITLILSWKDRGKTRDLKLETLIVKR